MGKPINENPNPAPRMNAPVVQLNPSSEVAALRERCEKAEAEVAALRERCEKAEAEADEWKAASAINGSNMAGYQTRSIVAEERLVKAEARAERLAAYVRMDIEHINHRWNGDHAAVKACALKLRDLMVSLEAHRDLEGGAA